MEHLGWFLVTMGLTLAVIFVNGWTDAPNAIASCVATRAMKVESAIAMAAVFNCLGVVVMSAWNSTVVFTIENMVNLDRRPEGAAIALCAALASIVLWSVGAWLFGIPTSESHSLIAGLTGAAFALCGVEGVNRDLWGPILCGLFFSVFLGFAVGFLFCSGVAELFRQADQRKSRTFFQGAQVVAAAAMAFMHGAQDGQKFLGVILLGLQLTMADALSGHGVAGALSSSGTAGSGLPLWLTLSCALVMGLGTAAGGKKIIKAVGMDMVKLRPYQGFSADSASAFCLFLASIWGFPVSTTHVKTAAIMGAGASHRLSALRLSVVREMALTWLLTFPGCGLLGYGLTKLMLSTVG